MAEVQYTLSLKDMMSAPLEHANSAANKLEGSMNTLKSSIGAVGAAMGVSFAIFKGLEFVHEGVEAFEKLHQAEAQVEAGLISTGHAAGIAGEELEASAKNFAAQFKFSRAEVTEMQSIMLTFPGITAKTFDTASQAILDMSTRLHKGLDETAIMVGKALQDPERGITAMRRVGVNFNDTQTKIIKHLVETGHAAKAQALILQELQLEFAGSAKAAAEADPLFRYNKLMGSLKMAVGETATSLLHYLTPALEDIANTFRNAFEWVKQNKDIFITLGETLLTVGIAYGSYLGILKLQVIWSKLAVIWQTVQSASMLKLGKAYETASIGAKLLTAAEYGLNAAWVANPIGFVLTAVGLLAGAYFGLTNQLIKATDANDKFNKSLSQTIDEIQTDSKDMLQGIFAKADTFKGFDKAGHFIVASMAEKNKYIQEQINEQIRLIQEASGNNLTLADMARIHHLKDWRNPNQFKKPGAASGATESKPETKNAKGNKTITINIKIDSLIKDFKISTTNIKEGTAKVQEMVTQVLMNAVNNSQIVAGQ